MFLGIGEAISNSIQDFFYSILWSIIKTILNVVDEIQNAFYILSGVKGIPYKIDGVDAEMSLLEGLFGIMRTNEGGGYKYHFDFNRPVHQAFIGMIIVFIIIFVFSVVASIIKISTNKQDKEAMPSMGKLLWKSMQSIGIVLILPVMICLFVSLMGLMMKYIDSLLGSVLLNGSGNSIGSSIFTSNVSNEYMEYAKRVGYKISYDELINKIQSRDNFQWFLCLLSGTCCLVGLTMGSVTVTERLINIVLLYLVSPVICATNPLDDGKRWETWKDTFTAKLTTVAGNVISIYIFLYIIQFFGDELLSKCSSDSGDTSSFTLKIVFMLIAISGAFCCAKGGTLIAGLVSANQGQAEGMSFLASSKLLSMGGQIAGKAVGAAAGITGVKALGDKLAGKGNGSSGSAGSNLGGSSGGGGAVSDAGTATKADQAPANNYNNTQALKKSMNQSGAGGASGVAQQSANNQDSGSKASNSISAAVNGATNGATKALNAVGSGAKKVRGALTVPGLMKLGIGAAAGVGALAYYGAKVVGKASLHPLQTAKAVGTGAAKGVKAVGTGVATGAKKVGTGFKNVGAGMSHLKNVVGNSYRERSKVGLGNVDNSGLGASRKDANVKSATKELNTANKSLYSAQQGQAKAQKQYDKLSQKVGNRPANNKLTQKLEKAQENLENKNNTLAQATSKQQDAKSNYQTQTAGSYMKPRNGAKNKLQDKLKDEGSEE